VSSGVGRQRTDCTYMKTQAVQHSTGALHDNQYSDGKEEPHIECNHNHEDASSACSAEPDGQCHGPQNDGQLLMGK
jgi:hypothetical protein